MQTMGITTADEMLQAQAQVFHHVMGNLGSMSLKCALHLEIPDLIQAHGKPMAVSYLLSKLPVSPVKAHCLRRLMRLLAQMGYFKLVVEEEEDDEAYSVTTLSEILLKDSPTSLRPWVLGALSPQITAVGHHMSEWLQSGRPGCTHEFAFGKSVWDMAKKEPEFNSMINDTMAGDSLLVMRAVVDKCGEVFKGVSSLVDVGGGTGTAARAIAQAFPGLKCAVFDLPHVIAAAPESPLVESIGGNMFESVPKADAIFLKAILHDWSDEECGKILKKCREAIPEKGGKVIIIDIVVKDRKDCKEIETQLLWDVGMMIGLDGKEREEHEWSKIFMKAGFTRYKITPLDLRSLIEVFP